jgi:DNA modification methylase
MSGLKPKDLVGIPWRVAFALQADGWYLRSDIIWSKPNPMPESVTDRPTKAHEYMFLLTKSPRYYYDADAIREDGPSYTRKAGGYEEHYKQGASRFGGKGGFGDSDVTTYGRNKRTVWEIATQPYPEAHFSTYPEKLVEPCILAGCPQDGVVLDPFAGSGTTLAVAQKLGRKSIGVDQSLEYINLAVERIGAISLPMLGL